MKKAIRKKKLFFKRTSRNCVIYLNCIIRYNYVKVGFLKKEGPVAKKVIFQVRVGAKDRNDPELIILIVTQNKQFYSFYSY